MAPLTDTRTPGLTGGGLLSFDRHAEWATPGLVVGVLLSFLRGGGLARVRPLAETRSTRPSFGVCTPSKYPVWQTECLCYRLCLVCLETRSGRPPFAPRVVSDTRVWQSDLPLGSPGFSRAFGGSPQRAWHLERKRGAILCRRTAAVRFCFFWSQEKKTRSGLPKSGQVGLPKPGTATPYLAPPSHTKFGAARANRESPPKNEPWDCHF